MALIIPKFATEREEADWWFENRDLVEQEFLLAAKEGRLKRGTLQSRIDEAKKQNMRETMLPENISVK